MFRNVKALICDDSMLVRKKLKELLEELECEVAEAANGEQAVTIFQEKNPNIIFMDIVMPQVDGLTALKKIRELDPAARIVMLSSVGTSGNLLEALKLGASDFLQKPYTREQIIKVLQTVNA